MFMDSTIPLHFTQESNDYLISTVIILLASILLFFASILGLYSVSREMKKALVVVSIVILIRSAPDVNGNCSLKFLFFIESFEKF